MNKHDKIYVSGHTGLVGSALVRELTQHGYTNLLLQTHKELYLQDQPATEAFFEKYRPDYVFHCAAKVGGVYANMTKQADFLFENLQIGLNVINGARFYRVKKLLNIGSVCIYPRDTPQPIKEEYLLTGAFEPTNEGHAIAKVAIAKLCQFCNQQYKTDFITVMPTNLYGINDNFDLNNCHVLPALLRKFHEAKMSHSPEVVLWGTGNAQREFLHADDLAKACIELMNAPLDTDTHGIVNVGSGQSYKISELAEVIKKVVNYNGNITYDSAKPDGAPIRTIDCTKLHSIISWEPTTSLEDGIRQVYDWYKTTL
jgi:GDP-L-fucose synthase